jgi:uncharacterized iron-regulated protein
MVLCVALLTGCAGSGTTQSDAAKPFAARAALVLDGQSGEYVDWATLVLAAADADVVFIGEMHGHKKGLAVAAALWEDIVASAQTAGRDPALSMEFFERDQQVGLDDYLTGVTDEAAFRKATNRTEGNYPPGHRAMIETAKATGARVYAANAPRRYSSKARSEGFADLQALRASQQRLFVIPRDMPVGAYKDRFFELMAGMMAAHAEDGADEIDETEKQSMLESFFRAQSVWDATMADTICTALAAGRAPVVHVVGQFHADREGGTVARVRQRWPRAAIVTISMSESEGDMLIADDRERALFVIPVGPSSE